MPDEEIFFTCNKGHEHKFRSDAEACDRGPDYKAARDSGQTSAEATETANEKAVERDRNRRPDRR